MITCNDYGNRIQKEKECSFGRIVCIDSNRDAYVSQSKHRNDKDTVRELWIMQVGTQFKPHPLQKKEQKTVIISFGFGIYVAASCDYFTDYLIGIEIIIVAKSHYKETCNDTKENKRINFCP